MNASGENSHSGGRARWSWQRVLPLFLLVVPCGLAGQSGAVSERPTISVNVNLVVLHVTVRDRKGQLMPGLRREDFHVFEDGRPQAIRVFQHEDMPVGVGLLVDHSSSMGRKRKNVVAAAQAFVRSSNPRDEMFIVNFNERVSFGLPPVKLFSADVSELEKALDSVPAYGRTALYDAVEAGLAHLKKASRDKKVLIVISDGGDNASHHKLAQVLRDAERSDAIIYTVGLFDEHDADQNPGVLRKIARITGGEAFVLEDSSQVTRVCEQIAQDIRHQYTIAYSPSNQNLDETYRTIRVTATPRRGKAVVRAREGYVASPRGNSRLPGAPEDL